MIYMCIHHFTQPEYEIIESQNTEEYSNGDSELDYLLPSHNKIIESFIVSVILMYIAIFSLLFYCDFIAPEDSSVCKDYSYR